MHQDATTAPVKYASVNGAWPANLPPISDQEAITLVKRLYRVAMKRPLKIPVKVMTGNRETWVRRGVFYVNPNNRTTLQPGWHDIVHSVSHYCHRRMFSRHKPHDGRGTHAWIEREMIEHVVNSGWLDGKLKRAGRSRKPEPTVEERITAKLAGLAERINRWDSKRRRAENALKKLHRQHGRLERQAA